MKLSFFATIVAAIVLHYFEKSTYHQALELVINSIEFKENKWRKKNCLVSSEIVSFSNFTPFFREELGNNFEYKIDTVEIVKIQDELLELNKKSDRKLKVFFSEQKNNLFFCEIFESKNKDISYNKKPVFGSSIVYMFSKRNEKITLTAVKTLNYN